MNNYSTNPKSFGLVLAAAMAIATLAGCGNQTAPAPVAAAPAAKPTNPVAGWVYRDSNGTTISFLDERRLVVAVPWSDGIRRREELYRLEGNAVIRIGSGEREGEAIDSGQRFVSFTGGVFERIGPVPAAGLSSAAATANQAP